MNIQKKLYASAQRKLVLWSVAAMILMTTSFVATAYLVSTNWLGEHSASQFQQVPQHRQSLLFTLLAVQGSIFVIGTALSVAFARKTLKPIRLAHQSQADFAANAHHQLNTPITVMQAEIDTALKRRSQRPEDSQRTLRSLHEELQLLRATSEELLLLADGASDHPTKALHPTSEELVSVLRLLNSRFEFRVETLITPGVQTTLSREELRIILETLVDNTVKHAGVPLKELDVAVALQKYKNGVRLTYSDNGKGLAGGEEKRIFERRFRGARAVKARTQGSGLGLSIVANIVHAHKGKSAANNMPTGGLQITISLPPSS